MSQYRPIARQPSEKKILLQLQRLAEQTTHDVLNFRNNPFDLSDALIGIAISLMALSALTQQIWLHGLGLVAAGFGVLMGLSGLAGRGIHPSFLIQLRS